MDYLAYKIATLDLYMEFKSYRRLAGCMNTPYLRGNGRLLPLLSSEHADLDFCSLKNRKK